MLVGHRQAKVEESTFEEDAGAEQSKGEKNELVN